MLVRWSFFVTFANMRDIKEIPDFVPEIDPFFSYIHKVSNHFWPSYDAEIQELTYSCAPHTFYRRYINGEISTDRLSKYSTSTELQDTIKAFNIDKEKFWYLCLLIKDYVEGETIDTIKDKPTHREELKQVVSEIEKLKPKEWGDLFLTEGEAELTIKVTKHPLVIKDGHTLSLIKLAIEEFLERTPDNTIRLDSFAVDFNMRTTLPSGYQLYLFDKYLSWFLKELKANKKAISIDGNYVRVSTDKKLLISRMMFVLGITDDETYYEEYNENGVKNDKLKNTLKNYKNAEVHTSNKYYFM